MVADCKSMCMVKSGINREIGNADMANCILCPRECGINRTEGKKGYCGADDGLNIASICVHRGEEPCISGNNGICNIFFAGCNLQCVYCQNHEISRKCSSAYKQDLHIDQVIDKVEKILSSGVSSVGFVSPSHVIPQVKCIIKGLHSRGLHPVTVYNTSGYDKPEILRDMAEKIDVYLVDYKYYSADLAYEYSDAKDYPETVMKAIKEMYYQKGSILSLGQNGLAESGLIIRHLVLPGHVDDSIKVLRSVAENISPGIHLSLMSQYNPISALRFHPVLNRSLFIDEYETVVNEMEKLGFRNAYVQDMDSNINYHPDFSKEHPFE